MKNKRGNVAVIAIIIVIVAITAGVVGWIFAKKTQEPVQQVAVNQPIAQIEPATQPITKPTQADETVNWQLYASKRYGYEIKYPKEWIISNTENEDGEVSLYNKDYKNSKGDNFFTIDVVSKQFIGKKSLEEWLSDKMKNDKSSEALVLGYRALRFNAPPSTQAPGNIEYYFIKDGMGFVLGTIYYDKSDALGDKILSTFKFTK